MSFAFKKVSTTLALLSFLTMAFFNFAGMTYAADGSMQGNCPFSTTAASLCPPSALPGAIHHINAFQSFLNVPVNAILTTLIIALFFVISIALAFLFHPLLYKIPLSVPYHSTPFTSHNRKMQRWLSLFEYSPSRS